MKRIKGNIVGNSLHAAVWLTGILAMIVASGAPHKWTGWP